MQLPEAVDEGWREVLDGVARTRGWVESADVPRLGALVARLSAAYNDRGAEAPRAGGELHPARLAFSFPRDVPKVAAAVRELVATGGLRGAGALRVLDLGAGLGASTWGLARALAGGAIEATLVDTDAAALDLARAIAAARAQRPGGEARVAVTTEACGAARALGSMRGPFDVVIFGQVLSELDRAEAEAPRAERHAELVRRALGICAEDGAVVVVEPALRDRTRHLHRVRDRLAASGRAPFAPCLHAAPCPMLASEADWCHEDLAVDLPPWLHPVARAAGLRWEGLTFSYLVLRRDGQTLRAAIGRPALRAVASLLRTKGKTESAFCGWIGDNVGTSAHLIRAQRLEREVTSKNATWSEITRGDVVTFDPPLVPSVSGRARIYSETCVARATIAVPAAIDGQGGTS